MVSQGGRMYFSILIFLCKEVFWWALLLLLLFSLYFFLSPLLQAFSSKEEELLTWLVKVRHQLVLDPDSSLINLSTSNPQPSTPRGLVGTRCLTWCLVSCDAQTQAGTEDRSPCLLCGCLAGCWGRLWSSASSVSLWIQFFVWVAPKARREEA